MWFLFPGYLGWFSLLPTLSPLLPGQSTNLAHYSPEIIHIFFESNSFMKCGVWEKHQILSIIRVIISNSVVSTRFCVKCCFVWKTLLFTLVYRWSSQGREWQNNLTPGHTVRVNVRAVSESRHLGSSILILSLFAIFLPWGSAEILDLK